MQLRNSIAMTLRPDKLGYGAQAQVDRMHAWFQAVALTQHWSTFISKKTIGQLPACQGTCHHMHLCSTVLNIIYGRGDMA